MAELTLNEKRLLAALAKEKKADAEHLASLLDATPEAVVQWAHLAEDKGLAKVERIVEKQILPTEEGEQYRKFNLPETQLFDPKFRQALKLADLQKHPAFKIGFGQLPEKRSHSKSWRGPMPVSKNMENMSILPRKNRSTDAKSRKILPVNPMTKKLIKRGILAESETVRYAISIIPEGLALVHQGLDLREEIGTLTRDQILPGRGRPQTCAGTTSKNCQRLCTRASPTRTSGSSTRCARSFLRWALPRCTGRSSRARSGTSMPSSSRRTTLPGRCRTRSTSKRKCLFLTAGSASATCTNTAGTPRPPAGAGSGTPEKAKQCVLRTHTTSLSIQYLATHPEPPVKAFCIGRVYRREAIDPTHTPEFEQLEGIVMDKDVTFRHLLGFLKEFYQRMGFSDVRFRPGFFPYTEPSVEPEIWVDGLGWVEMGGAGVFRQEVTDPWGVKCPVLAWGLGVSRVAMLRLGLKDLRQLYQSDLEWIRKRPVHAPGAAGRKA